MTVSVIKVDGVTLPTPKFEGVSIDEEKVWSSNTGRLVTNGLMTGTIVSIKTAFNIEWPALTEQGLNEIRAATSNFDQWHTLTMYLPSGATIQKTVYFGTLHYQVYSYVDGMPVYSSASIKAIER